MPKLIVANWKSHKNLEEARQWLTIYQGSPIIQGLVTTEVAIAPPFPFLPLVEDAVRSNQQTKLAVQDLSAYPAGAYTGAVSTANLKGFMVSYALLGHSERRQYFHETSQDVANKVDQAIQAGIAPIVCVDKDYLDAQAVAIKEEYLDRCIVAYEPLAAIGSGLEEPVDEVVKVTDKIHTLFGKVPVLYGGSVDTDNVGEYATATDGVLVASHSLDIDGFLKLVGRVARL